ncbi:uncharacterized protein EDB93DRAFT_1174109 [Suillus bovinus]|uniref:uncharacterized protein n=1 Tax=Suillus bovinus TaxID=48563 RepID=UPI001B86F024|nr:uncharacterized protein EDB93DRAFT_1174109 [Suillus bovinus]KAG2133676.1 hypothetical protein EDB93DRAFT_1174109 [Suillus bovinus]
MGQDPGILSNVFSFVSREIGEFMINATGKSESGTSKRRQRRDAKSKERGRRRKGYDGGMIEQWREASGSEKHRDPVCTAPGVTSRSPSPRHTSRSRDRKVRSHSQDGAPIPSSHSDITYPRLRKKPSITMPGSLFPRSDSLQPDSIPHTPQSNIDVHAQDSEPGPSNSQHDTPADQSGPSPWRTRPIASVQDAVQRFTASGGEERDFSLLVVTSPMGPVDLESPGVDSEAPHIPLRGVSQKGKERAVDDGDEDLAFILDHHRVQDKEKQLDAVRRETGAKSSTTGDGERDKDKERIRMLEEEVRMLKEELSRRHRSPPPQPPPQTQVPIPPPPPPLPPPPGVRIPLPHHLGESRALFASARAALRSTEAATTGSTNDLAKSASGKMRQPTVNVPSDKMAAFLNEMRTVRLRKVGSLASSEPGPGGLSRGVSDRPGPSGLSRSVSSSAAGVDVRRMDVVRRQSTGVNVSKVASTSKLPSASSIPKPKSALTASKPSSLRTHAPPSSHATRPALNNKRKADVLGDSEGGITSKRHSGTRSQVQSDTSSSSSSSRTHEFSGSSNLSLIGPSRSNETDITTPSLCSDNELGGDADGRMPSTPPGPRSAAVQSVHDEVIEIIDVDMEDKNNDIEKITPSRPQSDIFKKRPPMSPLPVPTPTRARAPARAKGRKSLPTPERTKRGATPKPKSIMLLDEDDDSDDEDEPDELALPPKLKWRREAQPRVAEKLTAANSKGKRRLTLDEELARARSSDRLAELGLESEELFGTGTGSKRRGFLAGGGAGGAPVFMGAGYVRGVEEDSLGLPVSRIPRRKG